MTKRNIILTILIFIIIIALFITCCLNKQKKNDAMNDINNTSSIISDSSETLIDSHLEETIEETIEETPKEEIIWIEQVDYTLMTKSQINKRMASLLELIEALEKWESLREIYDYALKEYDCAKSHLDNGNYLYPYSEEDYLLLAYMIEIEAGSSFITDEEQCLVANVIINRRNQGGINKRLTNPTIKDIINEVGQYGICRYNKDLGKNTFYVDINTVDLSVVSNRCKENARKVLEGEFTCPKKVVFQALFPQGEIYKTFYHKELDNTTYFCYGK